MPQSSQAHAQSVTNGFTPGGFIPAGYSYLDRAHSLVTPTRRSLPKGMAGTPSTDESRGSRSGYATSERLSSPPTRLRHFDSMPDVSSASPQDLPHPVAAKSVVASKNSLDNSLRLSFSTSGSAELVNIVDLVAHLPSDPRLWLPSQVALYLTQVLGLTPKLIVDDVTAYVRNARMSGRAFLRLREKDLAAEGLNLKWRKLMIAAVKKLRRDCIRTRIFDEAAWADQEEDVSDDIRPTEPSPAFARGTLKRLRDKQAVRGMITSFENIREIGQQNIDGDEANSHRLQKRLSISSLYSNGGNSLEGSPATRLTPIYGEGYVRDRAASFSSLHNDITPARRTPAFTREQLEQWFGDLTEQEANALADELDADQHHDQVNRSHVDRSSSSSSLHSHSSSLSGGDSALLTPSVSDVGGFDLTPIDAETVNAIVETRSTDDIFPNRQMHKENIVPSSRPSTLSYAPVQSHEYAQPLHKDVLTDYDEPESEAVEGQAHNDFPRPGGGGHGHVNPYRRSTYEPQDFEALGLEPSMRTFKFDTAKKISRTNDDGTGQGDPAHDSVRVRKSPTVPVNDFRSLFSGSDAMREDQDGMQNTDVATKSRCQRSESSFEGEIAPLGGSSAGRSSTATTRQTGTLGRAALAAALAQAQAERETTDGGKRAENEREWGVTVSRKASRRNTLAKSEASPVVDQTRAKESTAAARMSQLFSPTSVLSAANLQKHEDQLSVDVVIEDTKLSTLPTGTHMENNSKILLPLATLEVDADGTKSLRKTSMVLVDRRRFEALAKRMGVLEDQLAGLEAASLPPDSDLGSLSKRSEKAVQARLALDEIFASTSAMRNDVCIVQNEDKKEEGHSSNDSNAGECEVGRWRMLESLGAIPSYGELSADVHTNEPGTLCRILAKHLLWARVLKAPGLFSHLPRPFLPTTEIALGLAAGAGFVLISEVFGRSHH